MLAVSSHLSAWANVATIGGAVLVVGGIVWRLVRREIKAVMREVTPNGGDTKSAGDTILRTEAKVENMSKDQGVMADSLVALTEWADRHDGYHLGLERGRSRFWTRG